MWMRNGNLTRAREAIGAGEIIGKERRGLFKDIEWSFGNWQGEHCSYAQKILMRSSRIHRYFLVIPVSKLAGFVPMGLSFCNSHSSSLG